MAEEFIGRFYGNSVGTNPKFRVGCELQFTQEDTSNEAKGYFYQKRYFVDVTVASSEERRLFISWGPNAIKIKDIGSYAISNWIDVGWKKKDETIDCSCNAYYTLDGTEYKSTLTYTHTVKVDIYTVSYDANGGSGAPATQYLERNKNITISPDIPIRKGMHFVAWNTRSDGYGVSYSPGTTYSQNASVTLYAIWELKKVTVIFNKNDGTGDKLEKEYAYGAPEEKFPKLDWERDGYELLGLSTKNDNVPPGDYAFDFTVTDEWIDKTDALLNLYGVWKIITDVFPALSVEVGGEIKNAIAGWVRHGGEYTGHEIVAIWVMKDGEYHTT